MVADVLKALGISAEDVSRGDLVVKSPIDGAEIGRVKSDSLDGEVDTKVAFSVLAFKAWCEVPAPRRGELVRLFGEELRAHKDALGRLAKIVPTVNGL